MTQCKHFAMKRLHRLSLSEQTAAHLRDGLREGRWRGQLPGEVALAAERRTGRGDLTDDYCKLENLELVERFHDLGKSAYRGKQTPSLPGTLRRPARFRRGAAKSKFLVGICIGDCSDAFSEAIALGSLAARHRICGLRR